MRADGVANSTQELKATVDAVVESRQARLDALVVQHSVRGPLTPVPRCPVSCCQVSRFQRPLCEQMNE